MADRVRVMEERRRIRKKDANVDGDVLLAKTADGKPACVCVCVFLQQQQQQGAATYRFAFSVYNLQYCANAYLCTSAPRAAEREREGDANAIGL